jgi:hypothetical protein
MALELDTQDKIETEESLWSEAVGPGTEALPDEFKPTSWKLS